MKSRDNQSKKDIEGWKLAQARHSTKKGFFKAENKHRLTGRVVSRRGRRALQEGAAKTLVKTTGKTLRENGEEDAKN